MQEVATDEVMYRARSEQHVHVSWRAILAGIVVALAVDVLLTLLGFAVGLTAFEPRAGVLKGVGMGLGIWLILTAIASVFAGAYFGSRVAGDPWKGDGVAHGVMVWAGFLILSVVLVGSGAGKVLSSAAGLAGTAASKLSSPDGQDQAVSGLMSMGYSRAEAEQMLGQSDQGAEGVPSPRATIRDPAQQQRAQDTAKKAADDAAKGGAVASWIAFGIALLSLAGGALGGMLGAVGEQKQVGRYARRVYDQRVGPPSGTPVQPLG